MNNMPPPNMPPPPPPPDGPQREGKPWWKHPVVVAVGAIAVMGLISLAGGSGDTPAERPAAAETRQEPVAAETKEGAPVQASGQHDESRGACVHFRNVMRDGADGILTDAEMREKLKEVDDSAIIATPQVQAASRQVLSAMTTGTVEEFLAAIEEMSGACSEAGW